MKFGPWTLVTPRHRFDSFEPCPFFYDTLVCIRVGSHVSLYLLEHVITPWLLIRFVSFEPYPLGIGSIIR